MHLFYLFRGKRLKIVMHALVKSYVVCFVKKIKKIKKKKKKKEVHFCHFLTTYFSRFDKGPE